VARASSAWALVVSRVRWVSELVAWARLRDGHRGPRLVEPGLVVARVDAEEEIARLHRAVVVHVELGDVARDLGADDDDAALDVRVVGGDPLRALPPRVAAPAEGGEGHHDGQADQTPVSHRGLCYHPRDATTRGRPAPGDPDAPPAG
jgi:hypothetical protein